MPRMTDRSYSRYTCRTFEPLRFSVAASRRSCVCHTVPLLLHSAASSAGRQEIPSPLSDGERGCWEQCLSLLVGGPFVSLRRAPRPPQVVQHKFTRPRNVAVRHEAVELPRKFVECGQPAEWRTFLQRIDAGWSQPAVAS